MRKIAALLTTATLLCITCSVGYAQWSAASIPEELKREAHAVMRYRNTEIDIEDLDNVHYKTKYAITILDEQGKTMANFAEHYNNLVKINKIRGWLYDKDGKEIRTLKEKDVYDRSTYGMNYAFHSDSRIKMFDFNYTSYPYTVEFEVDETFLTSFFLPAWVVQQHHYCAVERSEFTIRYYSGTTPVKIKEYLMPERTEKETGKDELNKDKITWRLSNVPAYIEQPHFKTGNYTGPTVVIAANKFKLLEHNGDMQSWQALGEFMYKLNENRDQLPEDKKAMVKSLVGNETDTYQKIQKLYTYMQQNTRYVANEYGIAGWQTFDAENVAKNGYGDCKGLTNYLKAMLKEAGINAYAALVYAGSDDYYKLDEQFPCNKFNHVILCVPQERDSIWIECTSQQLPAGYLGSFTQGRKVLLITENGGFVCNTPAYGKDKSYIKSNTTLTLDDKSKQQKIRLHNLYSGLMQDDIEQALKTQPEDKIQEMVNAKFSFPSYSVTNYNYKHTGSQMLPAVEEDVEAIVSGIVSSTQKRTFVNVAWMKNPMTEIFQTEPRTLPFVLKESFKVIDSVKIDLPPGTEIEAMPQAANLKYPFAEYRIRFERSGDRVSMIREYEQNEGVYEAADFEKYQQLYRTINAEKDKLSIVLLNNAP